MPGEKSEQPTDKRVRDSRKKGQVFKSQDITQAILFLTAAGILAAGGGLLVDQLRKLLGEFLNPELLRTAIEPAVLLERTVPAFARFLLITSPMMIMLTLVSAMMVPAGEAALLAGGGQAQDGQAESAQGISEHLL